MAAVALAIGSGGALRSLETTVLLSVDETIEALGKAQEIQYRRPAPEPGPPIIRGCLVADGSAPAGWGSGSDRRRVPRAYRTPPVRGWPLRLSIRNVP